MYSPETIARIDSALRAATDEMSQFADTLDSLPPLRFEDTCCGNCGQGLCYVDGMTGA